jgi:hypothetical protein
MILQDKYRHLLLSSGGNMILTDIVDNLFKSPAISIPIVADRYSVSKQTARNYVLSLEKMEILVDSKISSRPKWYISPAILLLAYEDVTEDDAI